MNGPMKTAHVYRNTNAKVYEGITIFPRKNKLPGQIITGNVKDM